MRSLKPFRASLSKFSLNLLVFDHHRTWSTLACKLLTPNFGTISEIAVSSANFHMVGTEVPVVVKSFIMTKMRHGPMRVPCRITAGTGVHSQKQSELSLTCWSYIEI